MSKEMQMAPILLSLWDFFITFYNQIKSPTPHTFYSGLDWYINFCHHSFYLLCRQVLKNPISCTCIMNTVLYTICTVWCTVPIGDYFQFYTLKKRLSIDQITFLNLEFKVEYISIYLTHTASHQLPSHSPGILPHIPWSNDRMISPILGINLVGEIK